MRKTPILEILSVAARLHIAWLCWWSRKRDTTSGDTPLPTSNIRYRRRRYTKDGFVEELQVQKDTWRDGHSSISSFTSRRTITTIADRPDRPDRQSRDRRQAGQIDRYHLKETSYRSRPSDRNESYNNTRSYYKDSPVYQPDYHQDRRESRQQPQRAGPQPLQIAAGPTKRVRFIN